jgi:hypothetical protein
MIDVASISGRYDTFPTTLLHRSLSFVHLLLDENHCSLKITLSIIMVVPWFLPASPSLALLVVGLISSFLYAVGLGIYRLYFHPIAHFPGPKLAGLTRWYEFYYEVVRQGDFTFHIQDHHKKFGSFYSN